MPTIEQNRLTWIQALRSDEYNQGYESLIWFRKQSTLFCCMGVAAKVVGSLFNMVDIPSTGELVYDTTEMYDSLQAELDFDKNMLAYLIAMNDGSYVRHFNGLKNHDACTSRTSLYSGYPTKIIRNTNDRRDFKYIARFLEIAWKLTNMNTADTANHQNT